MNKENELFMVQNDYQWFKENYQMLFEKYGTCFLVIKEKSVIGSFDSYHDAVESTRETEPLGSFIVQYCNGDKSAYTNCIASSFVVVV